MQRITEIILKTADLVEAEGRLLRVQALRLGLLAAAGFGALLLALAGLAFALFALFTTLAESIGTAQAEAVCAAACLIVSGVTFWWIHHTNQRDSM
ncbi:MAG: hypothetical protein VYC34_02315 [Planctomycetota bacterium]|nr:hypothetical protein [Planctomycetota bacterium]